MIEENVKKLLAAIAGGNGCGEKVTLLGAAKTRSAEEIRRAVNAGLTDIGENRVQEFREKFPLVTGANYHFIGRLQTNKVKYLIGKAHLVQSLDRDELAREIAVRSQKAQITTDVLLEINAGGESTKGGYSLEEGFDVYKRLSAESGLRVRGIMAMLPETDDGKLLKTLCKKTRALFERIRDRDENANILSMGMSGDWELCVEQGSTMIRLGTAIFGERNDPV